MKLGEYQKLTIAKFVGFGAYLVDEDKAKVLLPKKQIPKGAKIGDNVNVFVYKDSKDRIIATTNKVYITMGSIAKLTVKDISDNGAFLDIGIEKDLFLPYSEQKKKLKVGDKVTVYMYIDKSDRIAATMYTSKKTNAKRIKNSTIRTLEYEKNALSVYKTIKQKFKGHLIYNDKDISPSQVKNDFGISKATFKKAIGKLLKDNKLKITDKGIFLY